jgi:mRNA interferase YafQ
MYIVVRTKKFQKSLKKVIKSSCLKNRKDAEKVVSLLKEGNKLPNKYKDHQLKGEFKDYRECHIKSDLLLVYQVIENELVLLLIDIGSHSELEL